MTEFKTPSALNEEETEKSSGPLSSNDNSHQSTLVLEENEELKTCLQQFADNKIDKRNAWQNPLIDTLGKLLTGPGHRKYVKNFQTVGQCLEAAGKIYGLRVDIVHNEVTLISNGLTRMNALQQTQNENEDTTESTDQETIETPKRRRKQSSTITRCKSLINAKLETIPFIDPIYSNVKPNFDDVACSKNAFLNRLETYNSELLVDSDQPFWDRTPANTEINSNKEEEKFIIINYKKCKSPVKLRTIFSGYRITDKPCSMNDLLQLDYESEDDCADFEDEFIQNTSLGYAFDVNADVEQTPENNTYVETDYFNRFSKEEMESLNTCAGFKRPQFMIDNMQPTSGTSKKQKLEYSYRPLNEISRFWAGPSYWKFKPSDHHHKLRKKRGRKFTKIDGKTNNVSNVFKLFDPEMKTRHIAKNWDRKKLKLPINYHIEDSYFEKLFFAIGVRLKYEENETDNSNNEFGLDISSHSANQADRTNSNLSITNNLNEQNDNVFGDGHHHGDDETNNFSVINTVQDGAEQSKKIVIPYAPRSKIVNMKQLKAACSYIVNHKTPEQTMRELDDDDKEYVKKLVSPLKNQYETYVAGNCVFYEIYRDLPKYLNKQMQLNLSVPLAFSAMVHLANEQFLRFIPMDEKLNNFKIIKINTDELTSN